MSLVNTRIVKIGNSQGIRIPKVLLEQSGVGEHVGLEVQPELIIIRAAEHPRQDWDKQFRLIAEQGDDQLLDGETLSLTKWEEEEWEW